MAEGLVIGGLYELTGIDGGHRWRGIKRRVVGTRMKNIRHHHGRRVSTEFVETVRVGGDKPGMTECEIAVEPFLQIHEFLK